jgi:hypothetical protein
MLLNHRHFGLSLIILCLLTVFTLGPIPEGFSADRMREIVLTDGSVIMAEVISFQNGIYSLRSETMGQIQLRDSAIQSIRIPESEGKGNFGSNQAKSTSSSPDAEIRQMQESMVTDPGLIGLILALQNDPEVQKILQDQEIMALITAGDLKSLEANPKFARLMNNQKIRAIIEQMTE